MKLEQILNKTAPWDMEDDGYKTRNYLERVKANQ